MSQKCSSRSAIQDTRGPSSGNRYFDAAQVNSAVNGTVSGSASGGVVGGPVRMIGMVGIQSALNQLHSEYEADTNLLRPLLMYNLESLPSMRADCRYKRRRTVNNN